MLNAVRVVVRFNQPSAFANLRELLPRMDEVLDKYAHIEDPLPSNTTLHTTAEIKLSHDVFDCLVGDLGGAFFPDGGETLTLTMEELEEYVTKHCDDSNQVLAEHQDAAVDALHALKGKCSEVTFYYKSNE